MNKIISINLNGQAYQLEEAGFNSLRDYFDTAKAKLGNDPDAEEIVSDLEQAVAERFSRLLSGKKNVITAAEAEAVIKEMGPVESGSDQAGQAASAAGPEKKEKRLYRIMEGKMLAGICTGLAAYFDIDVAWVRIIFVLLAFITQGAAILAYIVMIFIIPRADSSEQLSAAYGEMETAQELIRRAREEFKEFADKGEWKKWKREMKQKMRRQYEWHAPNQGAERSSIFGFMILAFIIFWLIGFFSIITKGVVFGFVLPAAWPLWAIIIAWIFFFMMIIEPLSSAGKYPAGTCHNCHPFSGGIFSIFWIALLGWLIWHFIPGSHHYFREGYEMIRHGLEAIKNG